MLKVLLVHKEIQDQVDLLVLRDLQVHKVVQEHKVRQV